MTSYPHPDYDLALDIALEDFNSIAGVAFDSVVVFGKEGRRIKSMLIVPQGNDSPDTSDSANAWLWADDFPDCKTRGVS